MDNNVPGQPAAPEAKKQRKWKSRDKVGGGYCLAFIGALVYYIQHAETFGQGALGVLKAVVWPALVTYKLLEFFKM